MRPKPEKLPKTPRDAVPRDSAADVLDAVLLASSLSMLALVCGIAFAMI